MNFNNFTIRTRLTIAFTFMVIIAAIVFAVGTFSLSVMNDRVNRITSVTASKIREAARVNQDILFISRAEKNLILSRSEADMLDYVKEIENRNLGLESRLAQLRALADEDEKVLLDNFTIKWQAYIKKFEQIKDLSLSNSNVKASSISQGDASKSFDQATFSLSGIRDNFKVTADRVGSSASLFNQVYLTSNLLEMMGDIQSLEKDFILTNDEAEMDKIDNKVQEKRQQASQLISDLSRTLSSIDDKLAFEQFKKEYEKYTSLNDQVLALSRQNSNNKAFGISSGEARALHDEATQFMAQIVNNSNNQLDTDALESDQNYANSRNLMIMLILIAIGVSIAVAYWIIQSISSAIATAQTSLIKVAEGDLASDVEVSGNDEISQLLKTMQRTVEKLREVIGSVHTAISNIAASSEQLSASAQEVAQGASEQAASAEEVSSSMEQMSANIQQNTDNAIQTEKIAVKAAETMESTNSSVSQTVLSMKQIADKINVIGEIANKTDLLALNAAVEAARAGEHGKGFAVVASAVRKLAESSQLAANEINGLSVQSVSVSERSGELLKAIVPDIQRTSQLVQEISASSREQSAGTEQVNLAIQQLNEVTQRNASASEEMATSSEELSSQAEELASVISYFKVDNNAAAMKNQSSKKTANKAVKYPSSSSGKGFDMRMDKVDSTDEEFEAF
ncbi:MAG: methyl-accepting chemotaxis protein [Cyclobacteriaceae bacterium]